MQIRAKNQKRRFCCFMCRMDGKIQVHCRFCQTKTLIVRRERQNPPLEARKKRIVRNEPEEMEVKMEEGEKLQRMQSEMEMGIGIAPTCSELDRDGFAFLTSGLELGFSTGAEYLSVWDTGVLCGCPFTWALFKFKIGLDHYPTTLFLSGFICSFSLSILILNALDCKFATVSFKLVNMHLRNLDDLIK